MLKLSTAIATLLITVFLLGSISYAEKAAWPLKGRIDLSSGFGDYRVNRFHAGIDLRTGGKIGKPVYSPVDGYVWRVKMSYYGYGKGLYVKGDDGHFYVFGHLAALNDKIDRTVKEAQNRDRRYYVDLYLPKDSIPVEKGEKIALSGQTGVGAPHLHFEKRSPSNQPVNPLTHGFKLNDNVRPTFVRAGFKLTDDHSLFPDGSRTFLVGARKRSKSGEYVLDTVLYLSSPFGLLVDCFDQMRSGGMRQAVPMLKLSIDGRPVYESIFDTLDFEIGPSAQLEYDHVAAAEGEKRIRRLYDLPGNRYFGSRAAGGSGGLIGADSMMADGVHEGLIEAEDAFGNKSRLEFKFMWGPEDEVRTKPAVVDRNTEYRISYRIIENGFVVSTSDNGGFIALPPGYFIPHLQERREGEISDADWARQVYFPPQPRYAEIKTVGSWVLSPYVSSLDGLLLLELPVNLSAVGYADHTMFSKDSLFSVHTTKETFYEPRFLALEDEEAPDKNPGLVSDCYRLLPEAFVTAKPFDVELRFDPASIGVRSKQAGLCWRDETNNKWVWVNEYYEDDTTSGLTPGVEMPKPRGYYPSGYSIGGGLFGVLIDTTAPIIANLTWKRSTNDLVLKAGLTYKGLKPTIEFLLKDTLSGIKDDRFIDARINGRWLIPEYEPELDRCRVYPYEPLEPGRCELMIVVEDQAGNIAEHRVDFFVKE